MKRIKLFLAAATFCAATAVGYNVYINATMTEQERLVQANLEALSYGETGGNSCYSGWLENVQGSQSRELLCATCTYVWRVHFTNQNVCSH